MGTLLDEIYRYVLPLRAVWFPRGVLPYMDIRVCAAGKGTVFKPFSLV